jgi:hypothetical protein
LAHGSHVPGPEHTQHGSSEGWCSCGFSFEQIIRALPTARVADFGRRPSVDLREDGIEPPKAAKAGAHGDLHHREVGPIEQSFSPLYASRLRDLYRAGTKVFLKQPAQMPRSDAESVGQDFDTGAIEGAVID